jgi:hypothetical protein
MKYGNPPDLMRRSFEENLAIARQDAASTCVIDVTLHAHIFGHPRGAHTFQQIVAEAVNSDDLWIATRAQMAEFILRRQEA